MRFGYKHLISFAMVLCLLLCAVPMGVLAADEQPVTPEMFTLERSEVVSQLKEGLGDHQSVITVYYKTIDLLTDEEMQTLFSDAFNVTPVLTATGAYMGDYLMFSVASVDIQAEYTVYDIHYYQKIEYHVTYVNSLEEEMGFRSGLEVLGASLRDETHNDYQRAMHIYDYISKNVTLTEDDAYGSAYHAYTKGKANAEGMAALFYAMAKNMGLDCRVILGTDDGAAHAWNIINVYDKWYVVDMAKGLFLKGSEVEAVRDGYYASAGFHKAYPMEAADFNTVVAGGELGDGLNWKYDAASATLTIGGKGAMQNFEKKTYGDALVSVERPWGAYVSEGAVYVIEEGVSSIGDYAFYSTQFEDMKIPASVQRIGVGAFQNSRGTSVELPAGITEIPDDAFNGSWVYNIGIPETVQRIGHRAFAGCMRLVELKLPASVTEIGDDVCDGCYSLRAVSYEGDREMWDAIDMGANNEQLRKLVENSGHMGFVDVTADDWYHNAVMWAVESNVTGGIGGGKFGPDNTCTRAQVVTFLWAANGKPEPKTADNPFADVANDAWYAKAVLWAVENNITTGVAADRFGPDVSCTRGQIVTFLYAAAGKPEVNGGAAVFEDVSADAWYGLPVQWAADSEITGGIGEGKFGPEQICTRSQVVTFLFKLYGAE